MDKKKVIQEIQTYFDEELVQAANAGDEERQAELKRLQLIYRFLPVREYGKDDVIIPSSLVELALGETRAYYFVAPQGGGLITNVDGRPVQVITPQSPLGEALLGKKVGDEIRVEIRGGVRQYRVMSMI